MPPTCSICFTNKISYNNKCYTCKKSICDVCCISIGNLAFDLEEQCVGYSSQCPFCRSDVSKNLLEASDNVCFGVVHKKFTKLDQSYKELKLQNINLMNENQSLMDDKEDMNEFIEKLNEHLQKIFFDWKQAQEEIKRLKSKINNENDVYNKLIDKFMKKNRKTIKIEELKEMLKKEKK